MQAVSLCGGFLRCITCCGGCCYDETRLDETLLLLAPREQKGSLSFTFAYKRNSHPAEGQYFYEWINH